MKRYNPKEIEPKWQKIWAEQQTYKVDLKNKSKQKYFGFAMLPYPSGSGLHTGHVRTYTLADVTVRAKRQQGFNAYNPIGWDAFGLPAENYAIKTGTPPKQTTDKAIDRFREQLQRIGMGYDWSKEINTSDPSYYMWTQWIFTKLFEHGLAYQKESLQWWCDIDKTVLANEQVVGGRCWRHDGPDDPLVTKKSLKQWFFKITEYADELLQSTDDLEWPDFIKTMQKNWIGKSVGAEIDFAVEAGNERVKVFTTRPDTIFGATFIVLAPEHDLALRIASQDQQSKVADYIRLTQAKTDVERQETDREKTGVFTGAYAVNPASGEKIPVWIADYVLVNYGTGAIMAVPAHDERDYEFAKAFDLPITQVIKPDEIDKNNPPKDGLEEVERDTVVVHLRDKSTGKFALLNWHQSLEGITTAIMGGIEPGQTPEQAALAEISEEAAIKNARIIKKMPWVMSSRYCASHKNQNRKANAYGLLAEVDDLSDQGAIDPSEETQHSLVWVEEKDVLAALVPAHQKLIWQQLNNETPIVGEGELINSGNFNGLSTSIAREAIIEDLANKGLAKLATNYKIRDWLISRQRYWGAPIPIVYCEKDGTVAIPLNDLPVQLPEITDFKVAGDGKSPLARATDWVDATCPKCGGPARRETDTMDGYACSSWYFLRYLDPHNHDQAWDPEVINNWMPIDFYNGADHAVSHLLYARFWTRFFYKIGLVNNPEPVKKLVYNAYILARDGTKMSKSKGNVVDPLEVVDSGYGADSLRVYEMFLAPYDQEAPWDDKGVPGAYRFLRRVWDVTQEFLESGELSDRTDAKLASVVNKTIKKVTSDIEQTKFNTAIAAMMEMVNYLYKFKSESPINTVQFKESLAALVQLMAPFAPHVADELWSQLGNKTSVHLGGWPTWDEKLTTDSNVTLVVQINGKVRAKIDTESGLSQADVEALAFSNEAVVKFLNGQKPKRTIFVAGKVLNIVV